MTSLPTQKIRQKIVCNLIKSKLLGEKNDPNSSQKKEVISALDKTSSIDSSNVIITSETWESWFSNEHKINKGKLEKIQAALKFEPPLQTWMEIDWLTDSKSEFFECIEPKDASWSLLLHLASIDALAWYRSVPNSKDGHWLSYKKKLSTEVLSRLHERWQLDSQNRVGLREGAPPIAVQMAIKSPFVHKDGRSETIERNMSLEEAARRLSYHGELGLMPSEPVPQKLASLYDPLSPTSTQLFLLFLPSNLEFESKKTFNEWSMDLASVTASHLALLYCLRHSFDINRNLQEKRDLVDGLQRVLWLDDCNESDFEEYFSAIFNLDYSEPESRKFLIILATARLCYRTQLESAGVTHTEIYEAWKDFKDKHPTKYYPR